ncbi:dTMP kinase [Spirillospora sp. NPDC048819]|uniref:dTMP kinase n=1 Tax=Spirillospora sp. NPDC048819 TaxID=3155268 RepID=UPI003411DF96
MTGIFIAIEGPNGVGKSVSSRLLATRLATRGHSVHLTTEPSRNRLGTLIRQTEAELSGRALALAVAADRAAHVVDEIAPALADGKMVISDRYLPSSLVLQRLDGVPLAEIWRYNAFVPRPCLTLYLEEDPAVISARLKERQVLSRLEQTGSPSRELALYRKAYTFLGRRRWRQARIDCRGLTPDEVVKAMLGRIDLLNLWERNPLSCSRS